MICTPKDARHKRCPVDGTTWEYCGGDDCMAWESVGEHQGYCRLIRPDGLPVDPFAVKTDSQPAERPQGGDPGEPREDQ
jgi:hypothetical protein